MKMKIINALEKGAVVGIGAVMIGASLTGALASSLDLGAYPSPFVVDGSFNPDSTFVVGSSAAASDALAVSDIAASLQFESRSCDSSVQEFVGGIAKDIPIGGSVASVTGSQLEDSDIDSLFDGEIRFRGKDYDTRELLVLGDSFMAASALSSGDDDYNSTAVLEAEKGDIKYYYAFDESIDVGEASADQPLVIDFLGKKLTVVDVVSDGEFVARIGSEYFLDVGGSVDVDGKTVTLVNVGTGNSVVVDVDGMKETVHTATENVNGVEVKVLETFYATDKTERSASLVIGEDAYDTIRDGDAFIGEDEDDPLWVWNVGGLSSAGYTVTSDDSEFSGPFLGVASDFVWNDDKDNPAGVGECISLPYDYVSICLSGLSDVDYSEFSLVVDADADFSDLIESWSSVDSLHLESVNDDGFIINTADLDYTTVANPKCDNAWLAKCLEDDGMVGVYYEDSDRKVRLAGCSDGSVDSLFSLNFGSTKGNDAVMSLDGDSSLFSLSLAAADEILTTSWSADGWDVKHLGDSEDEEADEVVWNGVNIGSKDVDLRTGYGIIVTDADNDEVVLRVPDDRVYAKVVAGGRDAEIVSDLCTADKIDITSMLDSELSSSSNRLILVGGPCVNEAASEFFGLSCGGWELEEGEALVRLAEKDGKIAMLVAGTTALDTRRAAKAIASFRDYKPYFVGGGLVISGSGLDDGVIE